MNKLIAIGKKVTTTLTLLILSCCLTSAVAQSKKGHKHKHAHKEVALGKFKIDGITIDAKQGHGKVEAGKESHLVITLPYKHSGATVIRAWIGTKDRTLSTVGKGKYASSHDDYDIHATAPKPLPKGAKWWVEIEKPDGSKLVGSIPFLRDVKKESK